MINKPLADIEYKDVSALVELGRSEDRRLEFKRDLPGGRDEERKEFLADISSLANADGGDLIFGVSEDDGVAAGEPGIDLANPDDAILRLESLARDGLKPRIVGLRSKYIPHPSRPGAGVVLMRVPASLQAPHQVTLQGRNKFYTRHSKGKSEMDVDELRLAFVGSESIKPRLRALHGMLPKLSTVPFIHGPNLLVSVVPINIFRRQVDIELVTYEDAVLPVRGSALEWSQTLEGFLSWAFGADGAHAQTLTYRTGWVEVWAAQGSLHKADSPWIWAERVEDEIRKSVVNSLRVLTKHGVEGPWFVKARLEGVRGYDLHLGTGYYDDPSPSARSEYSFSEVIFDDFTEEAILPIFRELWWAFGKDRPAGWKPRSRA